jgi:hypothetical protein
MDCSGKELCSQGEEGEGEEVGVLFTSVAK